MSSSCLDHLVVAAETLEQGAAYIREKLGVEMQVGGQHTRQGTHNLLLRLGQDRYLEVIAIDPTGTKPIQPRWFDLDSPTLQEKLRERPRLITWVARTDDIQTLVRQCKINLGPVQSMCRGQLNWQITIPQDGALIFEGLVPALIEWDTDQHPVKNMRDSGCFLATLEGYHHNPRSLQEALTSLGLVSEMEIKSTGSKTAPTLNAKIDTPTGRIVLD